MMNSHGLQPVVKGLTAARRPASPDARM